MKFGTKEELNEKDNLALILIPENAVAAFNMALDEALLEWHSKGEIGPVLTVL